MVANIGQHGIPYGVVQGNHVPELLDDIMTQGVDLSWKAWKEDLQKQFATALKDVQLCDVDGHVKRDIQDALRGVLKHVVSGERLSRFVDEKWIQEILETLRGDEEPDCESLVSDLLDAGLGDTVEIEEPEYDWSEVTDHGEVKYHVGWLGGAPLIWVIVSPWVIGCRKCSPCVPNAGDLDAPTDQSANCLAYSLPPDRLPEGYEGQPQLFDPTK